MKPWEIWTGDVYGPHPLVIVSNAGRAERKMRVVVLKCQTIYSGDSTPNEFEVVLDEADGLDRKTRCTCDLLFTVEKSGLTQRRGVVTGTRRRDIAGKIIQGLCIAGL
jgi:mRNA-degrading endonuclease toxin of MazEF toxin-antitoxin module